MKMSIRWDWSNFPFICINTWFNSATPLTLEMSINVLIFEGSEATTNGGMVNGSGTQTNGHQIPG